MKETGNNKQEHRLIFKDEQGNAYEGLVSNNKVETNVLSNFLNDSKNQHKSTNGAFEKNDFLSGMLNGISSITGGNNTSNNSEINQGLDNDLSSFLEKSKQSKFIICLFKNLCFLLLAKIFSLILVLFWSCFGLVLVLDSHFGLVLVLFFLNINFILLKKH